MLPLVLLLSGIVIALITQCAMAAYAFTRSLGQGLACVFVPFYAGRYARINALSPALLRTWYVGVVLFAFGIITWH
ncbi:hypothetical protein ACDA63_05905 [Uliginosibacterium sp. sgz301328]|uniref:hypothetical protein n=1 Tax=Uliginosibacterium sp. sgz301328 TaxID=3243764 RepID=UPI00359DE562